MLALVACRSTSKEETLLKVGRMIVDAEFNTFLKFDSIQKSDCPTSNVEHFLLIERKKNYLNYELYYAWISTTSLPHRANLSQVYRGRMIAIMDSISRKPFDVATQVPSDTTCYSLVVSEIDWIILYDPKHDRYVVVESLNTPKEIISQINKLEWNDSIVAAVVDTSVSFILPSAPPI